jgi:hypothetical protein
MMINPWIGWVLKATYMQATIPGLIEAKCKKLAVSFVFCLIGSYVLQLVRIEAISKALLQDFYRSLY